MKLFELEAKTQKCEYCDSNATQKFVWADGRAYVPICDKHEAKAKTSLEKENGEMAEVIGTKPL